jgi:exodeoxyribonuclease-3
MWAYRKPMRNPSPFFTFSAGHTRSATIAFVLRTETLKIVTFNINNVNKRLENLVAWLAETEPDVVCLQELKSEERAFPAHTVRALGYRAIWQGERSWNGVAILARECEPVLTRSSLPGNPEDRQARYIEAP